MQQANESLKLEQKTLLSTLPASIESQILKFYLFSNLDSTNDFLLQNPLDANQIGYTLCFAESQKKGRGRHGRAWVSPPGNIYFSLGFRCKKKLAELSSLSLVTGICVVEALQSLGIKELQLKWPNDVLWNDQKLCGILVETISESQSTWVVVGIGINLNSYPQESEAITRSSIAIKDIAADAPTYNQIISKIIELLIQQIPYYLEEGFAPFLQCWAKYDLLKGKLVEILQNKELLHGYACGVDLSGALLLRQNSEVLRITTGTVLYK